MSKLAYDYTGQELVEAFSRALTQAGVSRSGLIIDIMAGHYCTEAYYLRGVLLSRLEGKERPFTRGDHVRLSSAANLFCHSVNNDENYSRGHAKPNKVYEVVRVFYENDGKWTLSFKGEETYRYPADRFEKVGQKQSTAA